MRRFKSTPQKKFLGMIILFVFVPLFLLAYTFLTMDIQLGPDTAIIVVCIAVLAFYFHRRFKRKPAESPEAAEPEPLEEDYTQEDEETPSSEEPEEESFEETDKQ